jgi:hypothetical protein
LRSAGEGRHELVTDRARAGTRYRFALPDGLRVSKPKQRAHALFRLIKGGAQDAVTAALTRLPHQTKKYDSKSKHCGAQRDLGTTPAEAN